jgi:hypothetical protein
MLLGGALMMAACSSTAASPTFSENFSSQNLGRPPDSFLILDGQFEVREDGGNKFLELPGAPLDSYGLMFGPGNKEDWGAQARFAGSGRGRKFPVFGVSVNGVGGYRLQVAPAKKAIELLKGDVVRASVPYEWQPDGWTHLRIQLRKLDQQSWIIEGKAWKEGAPEPSIWMISWLESQAPVAGRAAIWGMPYAGTPIQFDDLKLLPAEKPGSA